VRDWQAFVRTRLRLPGLTPERESRIVRELAAQLEDFNREAIAGGANETDADAHACQQIHDWERMAQDVWLADRRNAKSRYERTIEPRLERLTSRQPGLPHRNRGGLLVFANILRDMRYAIRQLARTPGFTVVAIVTLALGIGASSAIFSVVNGVLLRPLAYPDPNALVRVHELLQKFGRFSVAPATFLDWRQQTTVFERMAALNSTGATLVGTTGAERLAGGLVSWDMFDLLHVTPALGRTFRAEEDAPGKDTVIILSHGMWQRRFGGDRNILGQTVTLSGVPVTVVGVMPAGFAFMPDVEFWRPLALPANPTRGGHFLAVIARMKPGVTVQQAGAEMKAISERLAVQYPENSANESAEVIGLHENAVAGIRPALLTLLAAVGVVILIACANVANLLLVRASVRGKEIAIRTALGAGRRRLILQMLSESLVLALAGGSVGLLLAYLAIRPIQTLSAGSLPRASDISIDTSVLLFALVVSVATGILFGLAPAWQASRITVGSVLKEGGRSSTASSGRWVRSSLLVAEVAMSIVLLVGAALLLRSFARLTSVDPGFRPEHVLAFRVALPNAAYPQDQHRIAFFTRLLEGLDALPEVTSAGMTQTLPMRGDYVLSFTIQGRPEPKPNEGPSANYRAASPNYFQTMGIPLLRGRAMTDRDGEKSPMVAVVDQKFVERHFPDQDPIGQRIDIGNGTDGFYEIVGVVGSIRDASLDTNPGPTMYVPFGQDTFNSMWVVARTPGDPTGLSAAVRQAVRAIDRGLPAFAMTPLATVVSDSVAERRFSMLLLGLFAFIALFLAAVGLYGVVAYSVSQRTQEIGLRMAIGAQRGDVLRMVVGGGMKLAVAGVAIGIACALALAHVVTTMATMLFEVKPFDPASYSVTALVLLAVAALACYVPARRATRVDPIVALRQE
jgi:putative ABC transport system permease protein